MERAICIFQIHCKGGAAIISRNTDPYPTLPYPPCCTHSTHRYWVEDNLMGSSSVVAQQQWRCRLERRRGEKGRRSNKEKGEESLLDVKHKVAHPLVYVCARMGVCVCLGVCMCAAKPHHSPERQKPCCDLCSLRYECWLRSSKTSIWQSKPNNKEARKMMCPVEWRNGECTYKS